LSEDLPQGWCFAKVREVGAVQLGRQRSPEVHQGANMLSYLRVANVHEDRIDITDVMQMHFEPREVERYELKPGDILLNEGQSKELVGRPAMYRGELPGACFTNSLVRFQASEMVDRTFALQLFLHWLKSGAFLPLAQITTNIAHLGAGRFGEMDFPLPPLNEQRRIVAKLEALQARSRRAREALDAVPPLLEKVRQSILAAAFRGDLTKDWRAKHKDVEPASELLKRIRVARRRKWEEAELVKMKAKGKVPTDDKWKAKYSEPAAVDPTGLPELPEGWCWAAWREVGFCQNGRAFPSAEYAEKGVKLLRPGNLHVSGELSWTEDNTRRMPAKWADEFPEFIVGAGELLMNLTAQSLKDEFLGRVCLSHVGEDCLLNQRIGRLTPVSLPARYWLWFFKSPAFRRYVDTLNTGSLIQHMFTSQVDASAVPLMPLEEAQCLVDAVDAKLSTVRAMANLVQGQADALPILERALLGKAFRGELVPQDPSDEPAAGALARLRDGNVTAGHQTPKTERRAARSAARREEAT
jgi:type I restriction enzyme S subunit